jgi:hypothetical protein
LKATLVLFGACYYVSSIDESRFFLPCPEYVGTINDSLFSVDNQCASQGFMSGYKIVPDLWGKVAVIFRSAFWRKWE